MILRINAEHTERINPSEMSKRAGGLFVKTLDGAQSSGTSFVKNQQQLFIFAEIILEALTGPDALDNRVHEVAPGSKRY